jgi:hypothetical protein
VGLGGHGGLGPWLPPEPGALAELVQGEVAGDAKQPAAEALRLLEGLQADQHAQEGPLAEIRGDVVVVHVAHAEEMDPALVPAHQRLEGRGRPGPRRDDQLPIPGHLAGPHGTSARQ